MVSKIDENLRILVGLKGGAIGCVSQKNIVEVLGCHLFAAVVDFATLVYVAARLAFFCRLIEQLAWIRILGARSDVVIRHVDNVFASYAVF